MKTWMQLEVPKQTPIVPTEGVSVGVIVSIPSEGPRDPVTGNLVSIIKTGRANNPETELKNGGQPEVNFMKYLGTPTY